MPNEQERALKCDQLAAKFGRAAEKDDARADEFRRWAVLKLQLAGEHPEAAELRAVAEELIGVVAYWEERSAWSRDMAGRFRRRADEHRARLLSGL